MLTLRIRIGLFSLGALILTLFFLNNQEKPKPAEFLTYRPKTFQTVSFSDGSKAWLDSGSELLTPREFYPNAKRRIVFFGDAIFKVEKSEFLFEVSCKDFVVSTNGDAKFSVSKIDKATEIRSLEGQITVSFPDRDYSLVLCPGQICIFKYGGKRPEIQSNPEQQS